LLIGLGPLLLHSIGLDRRLADGATGVMIVLSLSLIPNALSNAQGMWLEALSKPSPAMTMMWLANILNLAIDLVLAPGRFGAPALGAVGAACATLCARTALTLGLAIYIGLMPEARALGVFDKPRPDRAAEAEQRRVGFGAGASSFFEVAAFAGLNVVAGWVGALSIAAYTVALNVTSIIFMIPLGLSTATGVMVGSAHGARDRRATNRIGLVGLLVAAGFALVVAAVVWPTARLIAGGYTHDPKVQAMAGGALALCCLFLIPDAIQVVVAQSLRARGDVWVPSVSHLVSYGVVMIPLAYVFALPLHMGVNGLIWGAIVASMVSAALLVGRFWVLSRRGAG
jgi:MATE family multidrug resistance protein